MLIIVISMSGGLVAVSIREQLREQSVISETDKALAFACGYTYGQRAIIAGAGLPMSPPRVTHGCLDYRAAAMAHGFDVVKSDDGNPD